ncbi:MAG: [citrate (pro-3S)-lyase] ligase [Spirochaetales bacterium]|jgi:[citrate (pro-3S)-lyase] ligase|nr:[citrate (pro-3S)-lyase] ligase [Spirochaetales bacterium]
MQMHCGFPFRGAARESLRAFLRGCGLKYDEAVQYSVCMMEQEQIAATGSLDGNVIKCLAVSPDYQSEGLAATILTELIMEAARNGRHHLFLFTKPENEYLFGNLGFYPVAKTPDVLLMENRKNGIEVFVSGLKKPDFFTAGGGAEKTSGAIVANCNPFTNGHLYLIETAARQCGALHLFIVSEDKSAFSAEDRYNLVRAGVSHLPSVYLHHTGPYLVSSVTFPDYFLKDTVSARAVNTVLDLTIFAERFALPLGISCRFVGEEPFDPVTREYNRQMQEFLPRYGIRVTEIPRLETGGLAVSASRVRKLLKEGNPEAVRELVPPATYTYLKNRGKIKS